MKKNKKYKYSCVVLINEYQPSYDELIENENIFETHETLLTYPNIKNLSKIAGSLADGNGFSYEDVVKNISVVAIHDERFISLMNGKLDLSMKAYLCSEFHGENEL